MQPLKKDKKIDFYKDHPRNWWRDVIRAFQSNKANIRKIGLGQVVKQPIIGRILCYYYDPKTKEQLPHYDIFPLCVPIDYDTGGFLGLNLHYLPPGERRNFFNALMKIRSDKTLNPQSSLLITYSLLKNASQFSPYKECIKRYLYNHVRSLYLDLNPEYWSNIIGLPLQSFHAGGGKGPSKPW